MVDKMPAEKHSALPAQNYVRDDPTLPTKLSMSNRISYLGNGDGAGLVVNNVSVDEIAPLKRSNTATTRAEHLWTKAVGLLSNEDRQQIDFSRTDKLSPLHDILALVKQQKDSSLQKQIKVRGSKTESIILRDQFAKIAEWVSKFIGVGDALAQYDPAHAAIPWAAVRFVLHAAINESQTFTRLLQGLEHISSLITRYSMVETIYLRNVSKLEDTLSQAIIRLYTSILVFLAYSRKYYRRSTAERFARGVVQTEEMSVGRHLQRISDEEGAVESIARSMNEEYMREITVFMSGNLITLLDSIGRLREEFRNVPINVDNYPSLGELGRAQVLEWIDAIFTNDDFERALSACRTGTCDWILEREIFRDWMKPKPTSNTASILWIHGYPGFGKTILAARLTEYLRNQHTMQVVFFFCFFGDEKKQQPTSIIRSYIAQLIMSSVRGLEIARETYVDRVSSKATERDLWLLFRRLIMGLRDVVLVVDGFDECSREEHGYRNHTNLTVRERFLDQLEESIEYTGTRVLFISRDNADIRIRCQRNQQSPKPASLRWLPYEITRNDTQGDIQLYAEWIVAQTLNHKQDEDLKSDITARLVHKCEGMFLYLHRIQPKLKSNSTKSFAKLQSVIADMPYGLHEAYERELRAISSLDNEDRERALSILRWVLYAERPLTVREMAEALLVPMKEDNPLEDWFPQDDLPEVWNDFSAMDQITGLCGSLVDLRGLEVGKPIADQTVHFVHFTVKEYLSGKVKDSFPELAGEHFTDSVRANDSITRTCLLYLCFNDFKQWNHLSEEQFTSRSSNYAFLRYVVRSLRLHMDRSRPISRPIVRLCNMFLDRKSERWLSFFKIEAAQVATIYKSKSGIEASIPPPLYYASAWGVLGTMQYLLDGGEKVNAMGGEHGSPIEAAASNGHIEAVELLISNGANVNPADDTSVWRNPLNAAVANGHDQIVALLLSQGASINSHEFTEFYPIITLATWSLSRVSEHTTCTTIRRLIESGADVEAANQTSEGSTALHYAAVQGSKAVVELLLDNGARIMRCNKQGATALFDAARSGRDVIVETLLKHGADCNMGNEDNEFALHWAIGLNNEAVMRMLLRYGASVNAQDGSGNCPLHLAAAWGRLAEVRILLEHGADIYQASSGHSTALHVAVARGRRDIATLLLDRGAEINAAGNDRQTPLHIAVSHNYEDIAALLLDRGADVNAASDDGRTPLHFAISHNHEVIAVLLLERGADVNAASDDGRTPLHIAVFHNHEDVAALLLDRGAEINAAGNDRQTPLHIAVSHNHEVIAALLLDRGADVNAASDDGRTPLHIAVFHNHEDVAALLLECGAEINCTTTLDSTPLHMAADLPNSSITALLINKGANVNAKDHAGNTPLQKSYRSHEVAALLLAADADPTIMNCYSQNYYDHASRGCWETSSIPLILATKYPRQDTRAKKRRLHQSVDLYAKRLEHASTDDRWHHYERIGHSLLHLGDRDDSCTAFERQRDEKPRYAWIRCDSCGLRLPQSAPISGQRFVCSTCKDVDLCPQCMQEYKINGGVGMKCPESCEDHKYLQVPSDGWDNLPAGKVNKLGETEQEWLARLIQTYGGDVET